MTGYIRVTGETPIVKQLTDEDQSDIYNQLQVEEDSDYEFEKIVDHKWNDGILPLTARFQGATTAVPLECAKYIKNYVIISSTRGSGSHT
jgi:hypothetical protein